METRTYQVYKFAELPKEAQQKAIAKYKENCIDDPFLASNMREWAHELLEENYIITRPYNENETQKDKQGNYLDYDVNYSLSFCQGDGAMITMQNAKWRGYTVTVKHSGHYNHENSKTFTLTNEYGDDAAEAMYQKFDALYVKICKKLAKLGYAEIEYQNSDGYIIETIEANDYNFTLDGNID